VPEDHRHVPEDHGFMPLNNASEEAGG